MALLDVRGLTVEFGPEDAPLRAVDSVDFSVQEGEIVGIVGESGSGKSVASLAVMGLVDWPGRVRADAIRFAGRDLAGMPAGERRTIVGREMSMIFQEPMTSLNPSFTAGFQIMEAIGTHLGGRRAERRARAIQLLEHVGIPDAAARLKSYPHQLSGGMSQRVMIAMAISCSPRLLIADEPTTALDVTIQAQIVDLLIDLQRARGMALVLITHDLALVSQVAQRLVVMYAGQIVETGPIPDIFAAPRHPYTAALLEALPERATGRERIKTIPGVVPGLFDRPSGCLLSPRCRFVHDRCRRTTPQLTGDAGTRVRCHTPLGRDGVPQ